VNWDAEDLNYTVEKIGGGLHIFEYKAGIGIANGNDAELGLASGYGLEGAVSGTNIAKLGGLVGFGQVVASGFLGEGAGDGGDGDVGFGVSHDQASL